MKDVREVLSIVLVEGKYHYFIESMNSCVFNCMGYVTDHQSYSSEVQNPQELVDSFYAHHVVETCNSYPTKEAALEALETKDKIELVGYCDCCTFIDPVVKYQTRIEAEEWCAAHNIPVSALKEEKNGFVFTKTFSYV